MKQARWLISVPVFGARYVEECCATTLPALQRAVEALGAAHDVDVRLIIHTDQPDRVTSAVDIPVEPYPVPAGARDWDSFAQAHREALALALTGDVVVLLTAGAVISEQGLAYCADVLENPALRVVLCAVPRVLSRNLLPDTADAAAFMAWAWENRHPMTTECTWPDGRSVDLSRTFFVGPTGVITRQILPHPLAVRVDGRPLRFTPTVDANLMLSFDPSEMHMTPDCARLALIKLTPADKGYELAEHTMRERAGSGELSVTNPHQRWCMAKRVLLCGSASARGCEDALFIGAIKGGG